MKRKREIKLTLDTQELLFKSDTKHRKSFFTGVSFSHPAKMVLPLELWLINNYSKAGDVILDPMSGSGTVLVACAMGRHVITVELEDKFVQMQRGNWAKIKERGPMMGYSMGTAQILQGDARNLPGLLVDKCIFSDHRQGESQSSVVYIAFFEVDNPIAILLKASIPAPIFSSLGNRTMPEIAVGLNDSLTIRDAEINKVFTDSELAHKRDMLLTKIFGELIFQAGKPSFTVTLQRAKDTPITCEAVWLDIEGFATQSAMALHLGGADSIEAFTRAIVADAPLSLIRPYPKLSVADRASPPYSRFHTSTATGPGAVFASVMGQFTRPSAEGLATDLARFLDSNQTRNHYIMPLSILPQANGEVNCVITSPPYEASITGKPGIDWSKCDDGKRDRTKEAGFKGVVARHSGYTVDAILTSPPYEGTEARDRSKDSSYRDDREKTHAGGSVKIMQGYQAAADNIGNLRSDSYLAAMLTVYQNCYAALKAGGLMVLVTKNFIRNKKEVRLDLDTIKLCEQAGFTLEERHCRKLTQQSFWRVLYQQKFPDAPVLDKEDILIFGKGGDALMTDSGLKSELREKLL